ncbi:MAG TPA: endolytic transglycosylase MltG [Gaiellaceae bacterium]|nr:endolytic transglycosylase MltG [Gaiellaceae bacterium]
MTRQRPSRRQLALRRLVAAVVLFGCLGVALWLGVSALGDSGDEESAPPATTAAPPAPVLRIIFPEGFTRDQMAARVGEVRTIAKERRKITPKLTAKGYKAATEKAKIPARFRKDARGIEGFLFPATYEFTAKTTSKQLVADQLAFFEENFAKVDLAFARKKNLTPYDVLIIASMVEKETIAPDERPKVAAVIYNRLKAGMPLGIDATIRYGLDVPGTEPLRVSQLESDNPYNTRNRTGLPPTPIANPGLASIQAAAHPADVDFLFFVRKPDKIHHFFTASEAEFFAKACEYGFGCN